MSKVIRFEPKEISPQAVVNWLEHVLPETAEIYAVIKDKDGNFAEAISGEAGGAAFSALILQKKATDTL